MDIKAIRCSCCGSTQITRIENSNLGKCEHCYSTVLMPSNNEEIVNLLNMAYLQRASYNFDLAIKTYELVLEKNNAEKSAYEGLLLSKYGIEYVKDNRLNKYIPTCHRANFKSIFEDESYKQLIERSTLEEQEVIKEKANEIDKLQKEIAKQLEKEQAFDIFISYKATDENGNKTEDSIIARQIYDTLTEKNYKVFLAEKTLEDRLGANYEPIIFKAITTSKIFILVGTSQENINSAWVRNEWSRFIERIKDNSDNSVNAQSFIPVFKNMSPYDMPKINNHYAQGVDAGKLGFLVTLTDGVQKLLKPQEHKDVLNTFDSIENIDTFEKLRRTNKRKLKKEKVKNFYFKNKNKKEQILIITAEILTIILPLIMFGLAVIPEFPFIKTNGVAITYIILGVIWLTCFIFVIVAKSKKGILNVFINTIISPIIIVVTILCGVLFNYPCRAFTSIWISTTNSYDGYFKGYYYDINDITKEDIDIQYILPENSDYLKVIDKIAQYPVAGLEISTLNNETITIIVDNDYDNFTQIRISPHNKGKCLNLYLSLKNIDNINLSYSFDETNIYWCGTEEEWNKATKNRDVINLSDSNYNLYFNSIMPE